jgi:hypothetical protein
MGEASNDRWFYVSEEARQGPVARDALILLLLEGRLPESALVWHSGFPDWRPAREIPELRKELPPPLPLPTRTADWMSGSRATTVEEPSPDDVSLGEAETTSDAGVPADGPEDTRSAEATSREASSPEAEASGGEGEPSAEPNGADAAAPDPPPNAPDEREQRRRRRRRQRRRLRQVEERFVFVSRAQRRLLLWGWPLIVLTALVVWLLLHRANQPSDPSLELPPASSLTGPVVGTHLA